MTEEQYWFYLCSLSSFSTSKKWALFRLAGDCETFFSTPASDFLKMGAFLSEREIFELDATQDPSKVSEGFEKMKEKGLKFVSYADEAYPSRLRAIDDPPFGLFYKGKLPENLRPSCGIVGARRCTDYGRDMAHFFGKTLAESGVNIISGMALGIDGYAGTGALSAKGRSFAVLAGGADVCYPRENIGLYKSLSEDGGILSERPVGHAPMPYDFPIRNRIISALSDVLLVLEAAPNSGSLITAMEANKQGKEVFALPGRVGDRMSEGTNRLIKEGAELLLSPEDVLQYVGLSVGRDRTKRPKVTLSKAEEAVFSAIGTDRIGTEELVLKTGMPASVLSELIVSLEIKGVIKREAFGGYTRVL